MYYHDWFCIENCTWGCDWVAVVHIIKELHLRHTSLATVAVSHINRQKCNGTSMDGIRQNSIMEKVSEHVQILSHESRAGYIKKYSRKNWASILTLLPTSCTWQMKLDTFVQMQWNGMFLYCVLTPSPFVREEINVSLYVATKSCRA